MTTALHTVRVLREMAEAERAKARALDRETGENEFARHDTRRKVEATDAAEKAMKEKHKADGLRAK